MWLLEEVLRLGLDTSELAADTFAAWPKPMDPNYLVPYGYEDLFFIKTIQMCASYDLGMESWYVFQLGTHY